MPSGGAAGPFVVGISGPTKAGKSTLAENLRLCICGKAKCAARRDRRDHVKRYAVADGGFVSVISQDYYFNGRFSGNSWEGSEALNHDALLEALQGEVADASVRCVILEGFRLFDDSRLWDLFHCLIWLNAPSAIVRKRRRKDTRERFDTVVWPAHVRYRKKVFMLDHGLASLRKLHRLDATVPQRLLLEAALEAMLRETPAAQAEEEEKVPPAALEAMLRERLGVQAEEEEEKVPPAGSSAGWWPRCYDAVRSHASRRTLGRRRAGYGIVATVEEARMASGQVRFRISKDRSFRISKAMVNVLRHGRGARLLAMRSDGYVPVKELASLPILQRLGAGAEIILKVVADQQMVSKKERFKVIQDGDGTTCIRVAHGHSERLTARFDIDFDQILTRVYPGHELWVDMGLHGTFRGSRQAILAEGLKKMGRVHVHMSRQEHPTGSTAGVRDGADTLVEVDLVRLHGMGREIFIASDTGVTLVPEDIPPECIVRVIDRGSGEEVVRMGLINPAKAAAAAAVAAAATSGGLFPHTLLISLQFFRAIGHIQSSRSIRPNLAERVF